MRRRSVAKLGSKRRLKPIMSAVPVSSTTRRQARVRSASRLTGFSQKIALPARAPRSTRSACVSVGVQMTSASISAASMTASTSATSAPVASARLRAASRLASATAASRARGCSGDVAAVDAPDPAGPEDADAQLVPVHRPSLLDDPPIGQRMKHRCHRHAIGDLVPSRRSGLSAWTRIGTGHSSTARSRW